MQDMRASCNIMSFAYVDLDGEGDGFCVLQREARRVGLHNSWALICLRIRGEAWVSGSKDGRK